MNIDKPKKNKSSWLGWMIFAFVVVVFVGARQLHPGGIRGLIGDFVTESSSNQEVKRLRDKMLASLVQIGAAAICLKEYGENAGLKDAVIKYNDRNQAMMHQLVASIQTTGGMSESEKGLLDRQAYREARRLIDQGHNAKQTCSGLADRINSGEFDPHSK
jgi:hypothetical protein